MDVGSIGWVVALRNVPAMSAIAGLVVQAARPVCTNHNPSTTANITVIGDREGLDGWPLQGLDNRHISARHPIWLVCSDSHRKLMMYSPSTSGTSILSTMLKSKLRFLNYSKVQVKTSLSHPPGNLKVEIGSPPLTVQLIVASNRNNFLTLLVCLVTEDFQTTVVVLANTSGSTSG